MAVTAIIKSIGVVMLAVGFKEAMDELVSGEIRFRLLAVLFLGAIVCNTLGQYLNGRAKSRYVKNSLLRLKGNYLQAYFDAPIQLAGNINPSEVISRFTSDLQLIESQYFNVVARLIAAITQAVLSIAMLFYFNGLLALFVALLACVVLFLPKKAFKSVEKSGINLVNASERFVTKLNETLRGYSIIKAFGRDQTFEQRMANENESLEGTRFDMGVKFARLETIIVFISLLSLTGPFLVGFWLVIRGAITVGTLTAVVNLSGNIIGPVQQISVDIGQLKSGKAVLDKFYLDFPRKVSISEWTGEKQQFNERVTLQKVSFAYDDRTILDQVNFVFEKGKKYLISGESGCGKSTLLKLLMGLLDGYSGQIAIDGMDARNICPRSFYDVFGIVFQEPYLFNMTVKENILFFEAFDPDHFKDIMVLSGVSRFVDRLPQGVDTLMNSETTTVSGGEKQRIALARTLYHGCEVLLIDEATSSLDPENSRSFDLGILALDKTVIYVSHKIEPDIAARFDCVARLEDGRLVRTQ